MERKIGEIFEYNGEWYQVLGNKKRYSCVGCYFNPFITQKPCDGTLCGKSEDTIIKKLEKVGEPFSEYNPRSNRVILFQRYKCYQKPIFNDNITGTWRYWFESNIIDIETKQNKEDILEFGISIQLK